MGIAFLLVGIITIGVMIVFGEDSSVFETLGVKWRIFALLAFIFIIPTSFIASAYLLIKSYRQNGRSRP
jgi:hypothetical protein